MYTFSFWHALKQLDFLVEHEITKSIYYNQSFSVRCSLIWVKHYSAPVGIILTSWPEAQLLYNLIDVTDPLPNSLTSRFALSTVSPLIMDRFERS